MIYIYYSDVMGDMAFSGGFETLAAGKDTEGWMKVVRSHHGRCLSYRSKQCL